MKKTLLLLVAIIALAGCAPAQKNGQVDWKNIKEAASIQNSQKLYFMDFYTSWCGWCKKMDSETFTDPTVAKILSKYYIAVKFDAESNVEFTWAGQTFAGNPSYNGRKSPHQFAYHILGQKMGYPTSVFFSPSKELLSVVPGYCKPNELAQMLWYFASGDCTKYSWDQYAKIFDSKIRPEMNKQLGIK